MKRFGTQVLTLLLLSAALLGVAVSAEEADQTTSSNTETSSTTQTTSTSIYIDTDYYMLVLGYTEDVLDELAERGIPFEEVAAQISQMVINGHVSLEMVNALKEMGYEIDSDTYVLVRTSQTTTTTTTSTATTTTTTTTTSATSAPATTTTTTQKPATTAQTAGTTTTASSTQSSSEASTTPSETTAPPDAPVITAAVIPMADLEEFKATGAVYVVENQFEDGKPYQWEIDGRTMKEITGDFQATVAAPSTYDDRMMYAVGQGEPYYSFTTGQVGAFGFNARLILDVSDVFEDGTYYLNKFSYVRNDGEYISDVSVSGGKATVPLTEGGDYFIASKKLQITKPKSMVWMYIVIPLGAFFGVGAATMLARYLISMALKKRAGSQQGKRKDIIRDRTAIRKQHRRF